MRVVHERVQQANGDAGDAILFQNGDQRPHGRFVQCRQHFPGMIQTFRHRQPRPPRNQWLR